MESKIEQELRDEFDKWANKEYGNILKNYRKENYDHFIKVFKAGYSLTQEMIKTKDAEIERLKKAISNNQNIALENIRENQKFDKAIAEAIELLLKSVKLTKFQYRKNPEYRAMELMLKHDKESRKFLKQAKIWLKENTGKDAK